VLQTRCALCTHL